MGSCQFAWLADFIKNSISFKLWREIEGLLRLHPSGPEIFKAITSWVQSSLASTAWAFTNKLEAMHLHQEAGMNVNTFLQKLLDMLEKIQQCERNAIPADLALVVTNFFTNTQISSFEAEVNSYLIRLERDLLAHSACKVISALKEKYTAMDGQNRWPHNQNRGAKDPITQV